MFPAPSTINNMIVEAGVISKLQLGEVLPTTAFNTLQTDGTTKFGENMEDTKSQQQKPIIHLHYVIRKLAVQLTHWRFLTKSSQILITSVIDLMMVPTRASTL